MEKYKTTLLISPKSLNELVATLSKYPDAQLFAGGTYIMSRVGYYPNADQRDIISLSEIPELKKIIHVDKFVELGSMVTIRQLLKSCSSFLPVNIYKAISDIATSVVRRQSTIGGALCTSGMRFSLPCILSVINAQAEVRSTSHKTGHWIPVSKLYNSNGDYIFDNNSFITRIRIPSEQNSVQIFRTVGEPMHEASNTVIMGFTYTISQDKITAPNFCIVLPKGGFFFSQEFNNILSKVSFPLSTSTMVQLAHELHRLIVDTCKNISDVQLERAQRLLINTLYDSNAHYLSN